MTTATVTIVEVGLRDGLQPIGPFVATAEKLRFVEGLYRAGLRRMEATAFVSDAAVPQLADAVAVMQGAQALAGLDVQVLAPNLRHAQRALDAGARHIAFVLSVSEQHNMNNVRRTPMDSVAEFRRIHDVVPAGVRIRLNLATSFDCPFDGPVPPDETLGVIGALADIAPEAEFCLCDTTGRVTPDRVAALMASARESFPALRHWAFHGHDTYGLGVANVIAAHDVGIRVFDSSFAGLGGCPFAPGATGNVATEDLVWTFANMGISTGVDLPALLRVAREGAALPGGLPGGRVRAALGASVLVS